MATERKNVVDRIKDLTLCGICADMLTDARVLPCLHTFCLECLRLAGADRRPYHRMPCPICRNEFSIPRQGFSGLQKNFLMENLLEMASLPSSMPPQEEEFPELGISVPCDICFEIQEEDFATPAEATVPLEQGTPGLAPMAVVHCVNCRHNLCRLCYNHHKRVPATKSHRFSDDPEVVENFRKEITREVEAVTSWMSEAATRKEKLLETRTKYTEEVTTLEDDILRMRDEAKRIVDSRAASLLQELSASKLKHLSEYQNDLDHLEGHLAILESFLMRCLHCKDAEADDVVCRVAGDLKATAEDLEMMQKSQLQQQVVLATANIKTSDLGEFLEKRQKTVISKNIEGEGLEASSFPTANEVEKISDKRKNVIALLFFISSIMLAIVLSSLVSRTVSMVSLHLESNLDEGHAVMGVTVVEDNIYVLSRGLRSVLVYQAQNPFSLVKEIPIPQVKSPWDIVSSPKSSSLYVSDQDNSCVWEVSLQEVPTDGWFVSGGGRQHRVTLWLSGITEPYTLSMSRDGSVLLLRSGIPSRIEKYDSRSVLLASTELPTSVEDPRHVLETSSGTYIVSYGWSGTRTQGIVELTNDGTPIRTYDPMYEWQQLKNPHHLAIDAEDRVFVADFYNNRVLVLDSNFHWDQRAVLTEDKDGILKPHRLCLGEKNQLIISHSDGSKVDVYTILVKNQ